MTDPPPPMLDYRGPPSSGDRISDPYAGRKFGIGLVCGILVMTIAVAMAFGGRSLEGVITGLLFVPCGLLLLGLALLIPRAVRMAGLGVLTVVGVYALVVGTCTMLGA